VTCIFFTFLTQLTHHLAVVKVSKKSMFRVNVIENRAYIGVHLELPSNLIGYSGASAREARQQSTMGKKNW